MQFFWALNRVTVACPLYIQWPALDVLSPKAPAERFLARCAAASGAAADTKWEDIHDGVPGDSDDSDDGVATGAPKAGPMHAAILGRRGPLLGAKITDWIEARLAARGG